MRIDELTRLEILNKGKKEDPAKYARRLNYVSTIKPMSVAKDLFIKTGTLTVPISVGDYTVTVHVSGIMKLVRGELDHTGQTLPDRPLVYRALRRAVDTCQIQCECTCPDFCLAADTKIKLLDGRTVEVQELEKMFREGQNLWAYSVDENGDFKPGRITDVWSTGNVTEMLEVELDNGESILTTPEHRYMLRDGTYLAASELKENQSLMPLYFAYKNGYETVKLNSLPKSWLSVYKIVAKELLQERISEAITRTGEDKIAIHHLNYDKNNNSPENLYPMGFLEHFTFHSSLLKNLWKDKDYREKMAIVGKRKNEERWSGDKNKENRDRMSTTKKDWWKALTAEEYTAYCDKLKERFNVPEWKERHSQSKKQWWDNLEKEKKDVIFGKLRELRKNAYNNLSPERKKEFGIKSSKYNKDRWESLNQAQRENLVRGLVVKNTPEQNVKIGKGQKSYWENLTEQQRQERCEKQKRTKEQSDNLVFSKYKNRINYLISMGLVLNESNYENVRRSGDPKVKTRFESFEGMLEHFGVNAEYNHKVISVRQIRFSTPQPVYDITIEGYENFLVGAGVILHNCYRHAYWATQNNYKYGTPERRPSNITNPDNTGAVCKHTTAALVRPSQWLKYVSGWISTVIRAFLENRLGLDSTDISDLKGKAAEDAKDSINALKDADGKDFENSEVEVKDEDVVEPEAETAEEETEEPEKSEPEVKEQPTAAEAAAEINKEKKGV